MKWDDKELRLRKLAQDARAQAGMTAAKQEWATARLGAWPHFATTQVSDRRITVDLLEKRMKANGSIRWISMVDFLRASTYGVEEGEIVAFRLTGQGRTVEAIGWLGTATRDAMLLKVGADQANPTIVATTERASDDEIMTGYQVITETHELLAKFGLTGWTVKMSNRMTSTYGYCNFTDRTIAFSAPIVSLNPARHTRNTIAHEVAHAIAGHAAGHGPAWKKACALTGARPVRCYSSKEVNTPKGRWELSCSACGEVVGRRRIKPAGWQSYSHTAKYCSNRTAQDRTLIWTDTH